MAYEVVMPYHLHMPSYFLETFTEYPLLKKKPCKDIKEKEGVSKFPFYRNESFDTPSNKLQFNTSKK